MQFAKLTDLEGKIIFIAPAWVQRVTDPDPSLGINMKYGSIVWMSGGFVPVKETRLQAVTLLEGVST